MWLECLILLYLYRLLAWKCGEKHHVNSLLLLWNWNGQNAEWIKGQRYLDRNKQTLKIISHVTPCHIIHCMLNDFCVWPLPGLMSLPVHHNSHVLFSMHVLHLPISCLWSVLPASRIFFSKVSSPSLLQLIFENSDSILCEPYSLNRYEFLISALSSLLDGRLRYHYFVTTLKIIIYSNIVYFCLQTPEMYPKLNVI